MSGSTLPIWILSWIGAAVVHASALVAMAALVGSAASPQRSELRLDKIAVTHPPLISEDTYAAIPDAPSVPLAEADTATTMSPVDGGEAIAFNDVIDAVVPPTGSPLLPPDNAAEVVAAQDPPQPVRQLDDAPVVAANGGANEVAVASPTPADMSETQVAAVPDVALANAVTSDTGTVVGENTVSGDAVQASAASIGAAAVAVSETSAAVAVASSSVQIPASTSEFQGTAEISTVASAVPALAETVEPTASVVQQEEKGDSEAQIAMIVPEPLQPPTAIGEPDVASVVRRFAGGPCFVALPRHSLTGRWTVRSYGAASTLEAFDAHMKQVAGAPVVLTQRSLQDTQCAAIDFAQPLIAASSPAFAFDVEATGVTSGRHVTGVISGFSKRFIYVLLVDDDGMAQDVSRYAQVTGETISVDIPVHLKGNGADRTQLLFAISSDKTLTTLDLAAPAPAPKVVEDVWRQAQDTQANIEVAVTDFSVK